MLNSRARRGAWTMSDHVPRSEQVRLSHLADREDLERHEVVQEAVREMEDRRKETYACAKCGAAPLFAETDRMDEKDRLAAGIKTNKGRMAFQSAMESVVEKRSDKWMPFFESLDSWGLSKKRYKVFCPNRHLLGYRFEDGPRLPMDPHATKPGPWGESSAVPVKHRARYDVDEKALLKE